MPLFKEKDLTSNLIDKIDRTTTNQIGISFKICNFTNRKMASGLFSGIFLMTSHLIKHGGLTRNRKGN